MTTIKEFRGPFRFLSNFYPSPFYLDGELWPTVEHFYQAAKATTASDRQKILQAPRPGDAKRLGRKIAIRSDWENPAIRLDVMRRGVRAKFESNPKLALLLKNTGGAILEEGNWWRDRFWGVDMTVTPPTGQNWLGKILMEVRELL